VLTESAAMTLWIGDRSPGSGIVPTKGDPTRATFFRWLAFLVAAVYPTFTYGDVPDLWVQSPDAAKQLRASTDAWLCASTDAWLCASTDAWRQRLWKQVDLACAASPWFLGEARSAIDLYLAVMVQWRPRREWFAKECTHIDAIARRIESDGTLGAILQRHFGD
jgi:GST-like protein